MAQEPADRTVAAGSVWPAALLTVLDALDVGIILYDERQTAQLTNAPMRRLVPERLWPVAGRPRAELLEGFAETFTDAGRWVLASDEPTSRQTGDLLETVLETRDSPPAVFQWRRVGLGKWTAETFRAVPQDVVVAQHTLDFVAGASHDLKTPLTSIKGFAQPALRRLPMADDRLTRGPQAIVTQADHLVHLIDTMSDAARLQNGRLEIRRQPIDLVRVIESALPKRGGADQPTFVVRIEPQPLVGQWDAPRLGRAIARLVDNAITYSPSKGTITISGRADGDLVLITVEDQGTGIPPDEIPRLLKQSLFTRRSRGLVGSGLGLFIARGIVEAHQGTLDIESRPGTGTRVVIRLPLGA